MIVEFEVYGNPVTQGSKRAFVPRRSDGSIVTRPDGSPVVRVQDDAKARLLPWRQEVGQVARLAMGGAPPHDGPVTLEILFVLAEPQKLPKRVACHIKVPDLDKLVRAIKDALTGVVYLDDKQVDRTRVGKEYGQAPGVQIMARTRPLSVPPPPFWDGAFSGKSQRRS